MTIIGSALQPGSRRNGDDPQGMLYVVLTCAECLRAYPMNIRGGIAGEVLEISGRFCQSINRYIIQPSSHYALQILCEVYANLDSKLA